MAKFNFFIIIIYIFYHLIPAYFAIECQHRNYNYGSTVCVCNINHCDDLKPLEKTSPGIVQVFETTRNGDRFKSSQFDFINKSSNQNENSHFNRIQFDRKRRYQKIIGFGGAFTDSAGFNIGTLPKKLQMRLIKDYFGSDGIEYTLGRIPIGGSDFSTRPYTYDDHVDDDSLSMFSIQKEDFYYKIPYLKLAQDVSPHQVRYIASPWSSPAWMKTNNDIRHGGFLKGYPGGKYYKLFARYFVKFLNEYHKQNVTIWGITIENEPYSGFDPNYHWNCLGFNETLERDFLKLDLGPELYQNGYMKNNLSIIIYDDQISNIKTFSETLMSDEKASKYVSGIAFHWYHNNKTNRKDLDQLYHKYSDIFILSTEACEEWKNHPKHVYLGSWHTFNRYAEDIIQDLNHFTSGWIDWNLALDLQGGPNWVGNYVDATIIVNATGQEYYKQPIFYAMGHFSKFLTDGSIRLFHEMNPMITNIDATIFERPDKGIVMIILNQNNRKIPINVYDHQRGYFQFNLKPESLSSFMWY